MKKWYFCKQCGYSCVISGLTQISNRLIGKGSPEMCPNCNIKIAELPIEIVDKYDCFNGLNIFSTDWIESREQYINDYVSQFPEFNKELYKKELSRLKESAERHFQYEEVQKEKYMAKINKEAQKILDKNCILKCPICGSTNINKISVGSRAVKTAVFGVVGAIDDAGKTYKCDNCGSKF